MNTLTPAFAFLPLSIAAIAAFLLYKKKQRDDRRWTHAFKDKLQRPPGESLRLKIEALDERMNDQLLWLFVCTSFPVIAFIVLQHLGESYRAFSLLLGTSVFFTIIVSQFAYRIWNLAPVIRRHRLGFDGERMVGEHLNRLMLRGYRVFHDIPMDGFNIDHVVVGKSGILAVETKTRRKRKGVGDNHKVAYDGRSLTWPDGTTNDYGIENATSRARDLQKWLSSAVGEPVQVQPVLVFPGWYIVNTKGEGIPVLNPKGVESYIDREEKKRDAVPEKLLRQVCHQLEQKAGLD